VPSIVILCVDDEDIPRTLREMVLVRQGYTVLSADSAAEALELLDQHHVDLVLTDQMMPGVLGTELARKLRVSRPSLPIIIVSGVNEIPADAAFADRFVSKVEGPEALFRSIAEVLAHQSRTVSPAVHPGATAAVASAGKIDQENKID
jgi:CheY-like chemotaxis protein